MAYIDPDTGELTLRIVYDGAPSAGKTTNVRVLHETLFSARQGSLESPGSSGRITEFFDWRALDGGYLDGRPVRLHVLSVPGQWAQRTRRRLLLRSADAVCFVADASAVRVPMQARMMASLRAIVPDVDAKLVVQVNKTDLPDALPPALLTAALGLPPATRTVAARAEENVGVTETFLMAMKLATTAFSDAATRVSSLSAVAARCPQELQGQAPALPSMRWHSRDDASEEDWSDAV